jgi:hypothetical protein
MEHRWGCREEIDVAVRFLVFPSQIGTGRVLNISVSGAFLETTLPLRRKALVYLQPTVWLPNKGRIKRIVGSVIRTADTGAGLEWCESQAMSMLYGRLGLTWTIPHSQEIARLEFQKLDALDQA